MSITISPSTTALIPDSKHGESVADFVRWAIAQLELSWTEQDGVGHLHLPESDRDAFDGQETVRLAMDGSTGSEREPIALDDRFGRWLLEKLQAQGPAVHTRPRQQPCAVNAISAKLFAAYEVEGGSMHLGGCQLVDFPFLRLTFDSPNRDQPVVKHVYVAHDGSSVSEQLVADLGLDELEPVLKAPPRIEPAALETLIAAARRVAAKSGSNRNPQSVVVDPLVVSLVWVKHASGKLHFTIGDSTATQEFSGWAKLLEPKPFITEYSATSTFQLDATDDGRIDAREQIATCEKSGKRVLRQDLVTCSGTGKQVLKEFTEPCPVTGRPTLTDEFTTCPQCTQPVSRTAIAKGKCLACQRLESIKKDDPRLVWILGEHVGLERWNRWKLSETLEVYIAEAQGLMRRLLVVVDKETLVVRHLATASRFSAVWSPIEGPSRDEVLH